MENTVFLSISLCDAMQRINEIIVQGSITGEQIDSYTVNARGAGQCVVLIYEKHYWRASNRLTLTVTLDDFEGRTRMHYVSGGGGEGLFRFDWGAANSFEEFLVDGLRGVIMS